MASIQNAVVQDYVQILTYPAQGDHAVRLVDLTTAIGAITVDWTNLTNVPAFATVATTGDYNDLTNLPTIPAAFSGSAAGGDLTGTYPNPAIAADVVGTNELEPAIACLVDETAPGWCTGDTVAVGDLVWYQGLLYEANTAHTHGAAFDAGKYDAWPSTITANSVAWANITGKPAFATVSTTGDYNDLTNLPSSLPPNGAAGGELDGSYPNPTVADGVIDAANLDAALQLLVTHTPPAWDTGQVITTGDQRVYNGVVYTANSSFTTPAAFTPANWTATQGVTLPIDYTDVAQIINTPTLATVATTGDYNDLLNLPTLATVAATGDYADLTNTPTALPPNGAAGGELAGTYPNPTIADAVIDEANLTTAARSKLNRNAYQLTAGHSLAAGLAVHLDLAAAAKWSGATGTDTATGVVFGDEVFVSPGIYTVTGHGFTAGTTYYADKVTGAATTTAPAAPYQVTFQPIDANTIHVIMQMSQYTF